MSRIGPESSIERKIILTISARLATISPHRRHHPNYIEFPNH